jgi:hypothetical protein
MERMMQKVLAVLIILGFCGLGVRAQNFVSGPPGPLAQTGRWSIAGQGVSPSAPFNYANTQIDVGLQTNGLVVGSAGQTAYTKLTASSIGCTANSGINLALTNMGGGSSGIIAEEHWTFTFTGNQGGQIMHRFTQAVNNTGATTEYWVGYYSGFLYPFDFNGTNQCPGWPYGIPHAQGYGNSQATWYAPLNGNFGDNTQIFLSLNQSNIPGGDFSLDSNSTPSYGLIKDPCTNNKVDRISFSTNGNPNPSPGWQSSNNQSFAVGRVLGLRGTDSTGRTFVATGTSDDINNNSLNLSWSLTGAGCNLFVQRDYPDNATVLTNPLSISTGRWQFNVLTGDVPAQLAFSGDTEFSTWLNVDSSGNITADDWETVGSSDCIPYLWGNVVVSSSFINSNGVVTVHFTATNGDGTQQITTFTSNPNSSGNSFTGTYNTGTPEWSCPYSAGPGTFVATWLPNLDSLTKTYAGTFTTPLFSNDTGVPEIGPDNINATLVVNSDANDSRLNGTITIAPADLSRLALPDGTACLVPFSTGETLRFGGATANMEFGSAEFGYIFELAGYDSRGVEVPILGFSMGDPNGTNGTIQGNDPPDQYGETLPAAPGAYLDLSGDGLHPYFSGGIWSGTNNALYMEYGIFGGPCVNFKGFDRPFMPVLKNHKQPTFPKEPPRNRGHRDSRHDRRHHKMHHEKNFDRNH